MPRRKAPLEERLREWVKARVSTHGDKRRFGTAIVRPESWVNTYLGGSSHPDLDTTIRIAKAFNFSLGQLLDLHPLPKPDRDTRKLLEFWERTPATYRPGFLQLLEGVATLPPGEASRPGELREPETPETTPQGPQKKRAER